MEPSTSGADPNLIPWLSAPIARWLTPLFLLFGVECWLVLGEGNYGHQYKPLLILGSIVAGLIPPINRAFDRVWQALAHPSPAARRWIFLAIWIASALFLFWTQRLEKTPFKPKFQDEFSYLIQMRMLARGRFWMPALPLPQFFDTFYLITQPVYASMYFPGAAMMYVPALLLHLPYYMGPLAAAGFCAALFWLVFTEILDGASAILAVLLLLSLAMFRMMSIMPMAQIPTLLLGLLMTWSVIQWQKQLNWRWLLLLGAAAGWAAITRPADALCFAILLGSVMAFDLKSKPVAVWLRTFALVAVPVLPFLILQLFLNRNITGDWFTTPFARYNDMLYPNAFGFHSVRPPDHVSDIPQIQIFYENNAKGVVEAHQLKNLFSIGLKNEWDMARHIAVSDAFLWLIIPMSLPVMWNRRMWMIWGMLPVFLLMLSAYAFSWFMPHYMMMVIPAMMLLCLLPIRFLVAVFPKRAPAIRTMIGLGIIALALAATPQFNRVLHDQYFETPELNLIDRDVARNASPPAVILFHFNYPGVNVSEEPIYNAGVAWPDDAPIIRARDLNAGVSSAGKPGDLDRPLYEYYSRIDPGRVFYIYNRGGGDVRLRRLGTASQLLQATASPNQP
jgi:hypothetical protein